MYGLSRPLDGLVTSTDVFVFHCRYFFCNLSNSALSDEPLKLTGLDVGFAYALPYAGYLCWHDDLEGLICAPCPPGTYHIIKDTQLNAECIPCPPGEKTCNVISSYV